MKSIIVAVLALVLGLGAPYALAKDSNVGSGNSGKGVGNTGPGNQGNGPNPGAGNAGGNKPVTPPTTPPASTPEAPGAPAQEQQPAQGSGGSGSNGVAQFVWVGGIMLAFVCAKENDRDDKTPAITELCREGEMPDAFESYAQ